MLFMASDHRKYSRSIGMTEGALSVGRFTHPHRQRRCGSTVSVTPARGPASRESDAVRGLNKNCLLRSRTTSLFGRLVLWTLVCVASRESAVLFGGTTPRDGYVRLYGIIRM